MSAVWLHDRLRPFGTWIHRLAYLMARLAAYGEKMLDRVFPKIKNESRNKIEATPERLCESKTFRVDAEVQVGSGGKGRGVRECHGLSVGG